MSLLKPVEVARILRVSTPTVRRLIRAGDIPAYVVGSQKRIDLANLNSYLKGESKHASTDN